MKLTSKIMKEVHKRVRTQKEFNEELSYRELMSIVMKSIYQEIKNYKETKPLAIKWVRKYIKHNGNIYGSELNNIMEKLYIDLNIKHFGLECFNASSLAKSIAVKYSRNLKLYA